MEHGRVRNLDQIQENDVDGRTPRAVTILLLALGGACVVFAGLLLNGRRSMPAAVKLDPLGDLVAQQAKGIARAVPKATDLSAADVTFPGTLSDESSPTTALAVVKGGSPKPAASAIAAAPVLSASASALEVRQAVGDRLPVVPIPAQAMLGASPVVTRPRDALTQAASDVASNASSAPQAGPAGHEGGYQLQVSSFRNHDEAEAFAAQLRARGHKAYVVEAHVPDRGTWYRVRVGPFPTQAAAASYRSAFEGREHVVPFIVVPAK
jgi:cell division septation protein DedD